MKHIKILNHCVYTWNEYNIVNQLHFNLKNGGYFQLQCSWNTQTVFTVTLFIDNQEKEEKQSSTYGPPHSHVLNLPFFCGKTLANG